MDKRRYKKRMLWLALITIAMALALGAPSPVQATWQGSAGVHGKANGHAGIGHHPAPRWSHRAVDRHHHHVDKHRGHDHGRHHISPPIVYWRYPTHVYRAPEYWYYCWSYADYYPNVTSCPEAWISIPAS
jgi:hypothetical protein